MTSLFHCSRGYFKASQYHDHDNKGVKNGFYEKKKTVLHISASHYNLNFPNVSFYGGRRMDTRQIPFLNLNKVILESLTRLKNWARLNDRELSLQIN